MCQVAYKAVTDPQFQFIVCRTRDSTGIQNNDPIEVYYAKDTLEDMLTICPNKIALQLQSFYTPSTTGFAGTITVKCELRIQIISSLMFHIVNNETSIVALYK